MKTQAANFLLAILDLVVAIIAAAYRFIRRCYYRFCIKVLWKRFQIRTAPYYRWHDKRAKKLQAQLDDEHSVSPSF